MKQSTHRHTVHMARLQSPSSRTQSLNFSDGINLEIDDVPFMRVWRRVGSEERGCEEEYAYKGAVAGERERERGMSERRGKTGEAEMVC